MSCKYKKKRAKFGKKWYGRFGHISSRYPDGQFKTFGADEFGQVIIWPKVCNECAALDSDYPTKRRVTATTHEN